VRRKLVKEVRNGKEGKVDKMGWNGAMVSWGEGGGGRKEVKRGVGVREGSEERGGKGIVVDNYWSLQVRKKIWQTVVLRALGVIWLLFGVHNRTSAPANFLNAMHRFTACKEAYITLTEGKLGAWCGQNVHHLPAKESRTSKVPVNPREQRTKSLKENKIQKGLKA